MLKQNLGWVSCSPSLVTFEPSSGFCNSEFCKVTALRFSEDGSLWLLYGLLASGDGLRHVIENLVVWALNWEFWT